MKENKSKEVGGGGPRCGRLRSGLWAVAVCAAVSGCGPETKSDAQGGVVPWLTFSDTVELGGSQAEAPAAFGAIRAAAILADGARMVVADGQTQELHLFSLSGEYLRRLGGRGGGPGEHRAIRVVWATDDGGFCTWDVQMVRVSRFNSEGHVVSTGTADLHSMESIRPAFEGFGDECAFVLRDQRDGMGMRDAPEGMRRDTVEFVLFGADGTEVRPLVRQLGAEEWFYNRDRTWGRVTPVFGEELFAVVRNDELWVGSSDGLAWTRVGLSGDSVGTVEVLQDLRTATELDIDAERERRMAEAAASWVNRRIGPPELLERMVEASQEGVRGAPARKNIPAYDKLVPTLQGDLWIREYPRPSDTQATWVVFDSVAHPVGRVRLPRGDSILAASPHAVLIAARDEWDAPILRILRR